jgi:spore coat protein U-like protein
MRSNVVAPIAAGILLAAAGSAAAATKTTTFTVNAAVAGNCNITAAPNLDFGNYDGSAVLTTSGDIKVRCSNGTPYSVKLSAGGGTYAQRLLAKGTDKLQYNLFTDAAYANVWGDGTSSTVFNTGTGSGLSLAQEKTHTVYGQLPNSTTNQDAPVGAYADTITVTITY